jgi:hypothetical protein
MRAPIQTLGGSATAADREAQDANLKQPRQTRRCVTLPAVGLFGDGSAGCMTIVDLSYDGCKIKSDVAMTPGSQFNLSVRGLGKIPASVRWSDEGFAGLSFQDEPIESTSKTPRQHERASLTAQVLLRRSGRNNYHVQTLDLSPSGCRINFVDRPSVGERHWIKFDGMEALEAEVRWVEGFCAGLGFVRPIYPAVFELLLVQLK